MSAVLLQVGGATFEAGGVHAYVRLRKAAACGLVATSR